jgi:predicted Rossmann fold flavoprotein
MVDVTIIGAGPSGMMAAITASAYGKKVILCDKNPDIGKKMKLSGGGRCNITNYKDNNQFILNLPTSNGRFLFSSLNNFGPYDIYQFFEDQKVPLKIEKDDKVFPKSDRSSDFIEALRKVMKSNGVEIKLETEVINLTKTESGFSVETNKGQWQSQAIIVSTGGQSYPHTGSTGFGHHIAQDFGHEITHLFPTESPVLSNDPLIASKVLQGLSFSDIKLSLLDENNQVIKYHIHDLIITHFGLSGPAALKLSQFIYEYLLNHKKAVVSIDFIPERNSEDLINEIKELKEQALHKLAKNVLMNYSQNRFIQYILDQLNITDELKMANLSNQLIIEFVNYLKDFQINVQGIKPIPNAFVTGGGVSLKEVNPKTLESKLVNGLYFTGEVLDLHGYTGGYNITIALSTGYTAGMSIGMNY